MRTDLAPIVLFVYARPWHTEQTLEKLKLNSLAKQSLLYIYCDGPKDNASQEVLEKIKEVRKLAKKEKWCREVHILESDTNKGLASSIRTGVTEVIDKHGKAIVMEDDLLTSPAFLSYMNQALDYYADRKSVFSISAYCLPPNKLAIPEDYEYDVFVSLRNSSWGWATWADRWEQVDWDVKQYKELVQDETIRNSLNRGGDDVFELLQMQQEGKLDIWSIQFTMAHFVNHGVSIVPTKSYVDNIGFDGSGENCNITQALGNKSLSKNEYLKFLDILYQDKRIINSFYNVSCRRKRPLWKKVMNRIWRIFGGENIFMIKGKIYY